MKLTETYNWAVPEADDPADITKISDVIEEVDSVVKSSEDKMNNLSKDLNFLLEKYQDLEQELKSTKDKYYPVGKIYITIGDENPNDTIGGTWIKTSKGRMLLGTGVNEQSNNDHINSFGSKASPGSDPYIFQNAGKQGGEFKHELNVNEMPKHNHTSSTQGEYLMTNDAPDAYSMKFKTASSIDKNVYTDAQMPGTFHHRTRTNTVGNSSKHNNMPPYMTVHIWKRVK